METDFEDGSAAYYDKNINKIMLHPFVRALFAQMKLLKKKASPEEACRLFDEFQRKYSPFMMERVKCWGEDTLVALGEIKARYSQYIDFARGVGATGHSFGGAAAYYLCHNSDEFSCGINIDGALYGDYSGKTMKKPFYRIACKENLNFEAKPLFDTTAPVYSAVFNDMKHIGFTDPKRFVNVKSLVGTLPFETMHENLTACHLGFFGRYLKGDENAVIGTTNEAVKFEQNN